MIQAQSAEHDAGCADQALTRFRLDGRVCVVTGGSSGLGERFARVLHGAGASVVLAARRRDRLERICSELDRAVAVECDVTDPGDLNRLTQAARSVNGRIDVLVNSAGIGVSAPAENEDVEKFRAVLSVNLVGAFSASQAVGRTMLEQGEGVIVNVASILGLVGLGVVPLASYAASKGGLINLTRELAAQWAHRGVRVNALAPGFVETGMNKKLFAEDAAIQWLRRKVPLRRIPDISEFDGALLFLASDASSFVTGQVIVVDGGYTAV